MARQPLIDERRNRQDPQSKYIEDALSEAMTEDKPKSSAPDKSPRPKARPSYSKRPKAFPETARGGPATKNYGGKMKKMKMGGVCRGMGAATRGGNFYKDG